MTLNATKYIMSASGGGESYWAAFLGGSQADPFFDLKIDSNGDIVCAGKTYSDGAGNQDFLIAKFDKEGELLWDRTLGKSGKSAEAYGIAIDSSNNIYVSGYANITSRGEQWLIAKYNSSGVIQWNKHVGPSGAGSADRCRGIAVDSSDNIICVGTIQSSPAYQEEAVVAKFDSSGGQLWDRKLDGSGNDEYRSVAVDSSDNIYAVGGSASGSSGDKDFLVAKYNSSGTIQWKKILGGSSLEYADGVALDSSANIYMIGRTYSSAGATGDFLLAKYDSSGTFQFDKVLGGTGIDNGKGVTVDSSGNVYVTGDSTSVGPSSYSSVVVKYNSSGVVQWQNVFGGSGRGDSNAIALDADGNVYFCGYDKTVGAGDEEGMLVKVRGDGSGTGTFGSFTYATSTLTASEISLTDQTAGANDGGISMDINDASFSDAPAVLTSTKVNM